jgi:hypothetical protein
VDQDPKPKQAKVVVTSLPRLSLEEQVKLENQIMRFFTACNVPFHTVGHPNQAPPLQKAFGFVHVQEGSCNRVHQFDADDARADLPAS